MATLKLVDIGEAVGILAAQSIGEPGTQLTLRTFHIGGTAVNIAAQTLRRSKFDAVIGLERVTVVKSPSTKETIVTSREGEIVLKTPEGQVRSKLRVPYGATLAVKENSKIKANDELFSWVPYAEPMVADVGGVVKFIDIVDNQTMREELDESTGRRQMTIIEDRSKKLHPTIQICKKTKKGEMQREFIMAVGHVRFGDIKRGKREVIVSSELDSDDERTYLVPVGKHMRVHGGDHVRAGDKLSEGPINPHDILRVKGPRKVQEHLLNEVQEVYRLQGVKINDKHIAVMVRQMLQKVRITDPGETDVLEGENVDRSEFRAINRVAMAEGLKPARSEPLLLGITKASLTTESFVSAASFQETTRVLTDAAVRGAKDDLKGLKENIIIGHLIPAGTGVHRYEDVDFVVDQSFYEEEILPLTDPDGLLAELEGLTAE